MGDGARPRPPALAGPLERQRRLDAAVRERVREPVGADAQADERLERVGHRSRAASSAATAARQSSRCALTLPISARLPSTSRRRARGRRAPRRAAGRRCRAARDAVAAQQPERASHDLGVAGRLEHDVEAADVVRGRLRHGARPRRDVARAEAAASSAAARPARREAAVHTSSPSSRSRQVASIPIAPVPSTSARRGAHGWRSPTARAWRIARAQTDGGLGQHAERGRAPAGTGTRCSGASATSSRANPSQRA